MQTPSPAPGINQCQKGGVETEALQTCVIMLSICYWIFYRNLCSFKYLFYVLYFYMGLVLCKYSGLHVVVLPAVSSSSWPPLSGRVFKAASCFQWVLVCVSQCVTYLMFINSTSCAHSVTSAFLKTKIPHYQLTHSSLFCGGSWGVERILANTGWESLVHHSTNTKRQPRIPTFTPAAI